MEKVSTYPNEVLTLDPLDLFDVSHWTGLVYNESQKLKWSTLKAAVDNIYNIDGVVTGGNRNINNGGFVMSFTGTGQYSWGTTLPMGNYHFATVAQEDALVIDSLGRSGFGIDSPQAAVHIYNDGVHLAQPAETFLLIQNSALSGDDCVMTIMSGDAASAELTFTDESNVRLGAVRYDHVLDTMSFVTNELAKMHIDPAGRVGIGILFEFPQALLHVSADVVPAAQPTWNNADTAVFSRDGDQFIHLQGATDSLQGIYFTDNSRGSGQIRYDHLTNHMEFRTNGTERIHITSTGLVGINQSDPELYLHVTKTEGIEGTPVWTADDVAVFQNNTSTESHAHINIIGGNIGEAAVNFGSGGNRVSGQIRKDHNLAKLFIQGTVADHVTLTDGGLMGILTDAPVHELHIMGNAGSVDTPTIRIDNGNVNGFFDVGVNGSDVFRIVTSAGLSPFKIDDDAIANTLVLTSAGVGFGTIAPDEAAHILQSGTGGAGLRIEDDNAAYTVKTIQGDFRVIDDDSSTSPFIIKQTAPNNSLHINAAGAVGIGGIASGASVAMEIIGTTKAFKLNVVTTTEMNALTGAEGMMVMNSTLNRIQGYTNGSWSNVT